MELAPKTQRAASAGDRSSEPRGTPRAMRPTGDLPAGTVIPRPQEPQKLAPSCTPPPLKRPNAAPPPKVAENCTPDPRGRKPPTRPPKAPNPKPPNTRAARKKTPRTLWRYGASRVEWELVK